MKKCSGCELNYVNDNEELCHICKQYKNSKLSNLRDNNKDKVQKFLVPFLMRLSTDIIESFTKKELSFSVFKIHHPLLVECKNIDKEHCKQEVMVGNSSTYRYYIEPYNINGKYYHICSQWADCGIEESKDMLKMISTLMI